ncbi:LysR family transcriptional regulator [Agaricicola taiwanensis]|nr:LysR family transcriptional regulator [Agaricicola taiwanensis]
MWDDFRLVKAIADRRTLAGAADTLAINTSTVFRRLGALEERLGTKLFERGRVGYALTPSGEEMVGLASRMADDVASFERRIAGRDLKPSGELRITTNDSFIIHMLTPIFARFREAFPDIRLEIIVGNQSLNLSRRDADIAIRATAHPTETLVGRRIASVAWTIYGRKGDEHPRERDEFRGLPWVGFSDSLPVSANGALADLTGQEAVYRLNTVLGLSHAIAAGMGIGSLPCFIGDAEPTLERLAEPQDDSSGAGLWLLTHADLKASARVRAFLDFAGAELMALKPLIEGRRAQAD